MPTSSSITRIRDFTLPRIDTDGAYRSLLRCGSVDVNGQDVSRVRGVGDPVVVVGRIHRSAIDFEHDLIALEAGVVRRAQRIDASDDDPVDAAREPQAAR